MTACHFAVTLDYCAFLSLLLCVGLIFDPTNIMQSCNTTFLYCSKLTNSVQGYNLYVYTCMCMFAFFKFVCVHTLWYDGC